MSDGVLVLLVKAVNKDNNGCSASELIKVFFIQVLNCCFILLYFHFSVVFGFDSFISIGTHCRNVIIMAQVTPSLVDLHTSKCIIKGYVLVVS